MSTPEKCFHCPRETMYATTQDLLEKIRDFQTAYSEQALDETTATEVAELLNRLGMHENADADMVRQLMLENFELLDAFEATIEEKRAQETRFCVGALRLRAKDTHTQYDVAICRSPQSDSILPGDLRMAVVQTRSIK